MVSPPDENLVVAIATRLMLDGDSAASAVIDSTEVAITYGTSWWDGHDDYIYEASVTIHFSPEAESRLRTSEAAVVSALREIVDHFQDESGTWRRGTLQSLSLRPGQVQVDPRRRESRRFEAQRLVESERGHDDPR